MKTLKPGDRVRVYQCDDSGVSDVVDYEVSHVEGDAVWVKCHTNDKTREFEWPYHRKCVRKLVKKPRRRVWIPEYLLLGDALHQDTRLPARVCYPQNDATEQVEFVEVRKK